MVKNIYIYNFSCPAGNVFSVSAQTAKGEEAEHLREFSLETFSVLARLSVFLQDDRSGRPGFSNSKHVC